MKYSTMAEDVFLLSLQGLLLSIIVNIVVKICAARGMSVPEGSRSAFHRVAWTA